MEEGGFMMDIFTLGGGFMNEIYQCGKGMEIYFSWIISESGVISIMVIQERNQFV